MGIFFGCSSDRHFAKDFENNVIQAKVSGYITDNIDDIKWQESISKQVLHIDRHLRIFSVLVRMYRREVIEGKKYKSDTRFFKANQCLRMEIMLDLDSYLDLPEEKIRELICDEVFDYVKSMLIKYQKRLENLDVNAFIPLFKQRIEEIKNGVFEDNFYQSNHYKNLVFANELSKQQLSDTEIVNHLKTTYKTEHGDLPAGNKI